MAIASGDVAEVFQSDKETGMIILLSMMSLDAHTVERHEVSRCFEIGPQAS